MDPWNVIKMYVCKYVTAVSEYTIGWLKWEEKRFFPKKRGWKCILHIVQGFSSFGHSVCGDYMKTIK
jgi:hypothetical protein